MNRSAVNVRADLIPAGGLASPARQDAPARRTGYLFHPVTDFLLAGGGSVLIAAPIFWLIRDKAAAHPVALSFSLVIGVFLNYPHFAHSYQLLYSGIGRRIFGFDSTPKVRLKYIWAGFVAPTLIAAFLIGAYLAGDVRLLGFAANAFWFATGWHYVKQGYGVITVLSAVRRIYYSDLEKKLLLLNGYAVWIYSWMALNVELHEQTFFGVRYFTFELPRIAITAGMLATVLTTTALAIALAHRVFVRKQPVSWNGIVGYVCSLYLWVIAFYADPIFTLFVPAFHSLQYMLFVWRYQLNKAAVEANPGANGGAVAARPAIGQLARFVAVGLGLGLLGFVILPALLQAELSPDPTVWGPTVFSFMFVAWINLHHYFIDNVIWRRDNEDVRRFLFAAR